MTRKIPEDPYEDSKKSPQIPVWRHPRPALPRAHPSAGEPAPALRHLFLVPGNPGYRQQREQMKELEAKILNLKRENQSLFDKIVSFKNDPLAQERQVRQELGWVREGEIMIEFGAPDKEDSKKK